MIGCTQGAPLCAYTYRTVPSMSYRTTTGALVYTRITLLRKEEVFCLKWKQVQNKGKEEGNNHTL
jgi:hypothetical protein